MRNNPDTSKSAYNIIPYKNSPFSHPSKHISKLENKVFGKLKVIRRIGKNKYNKMIWQCLCECGETTYCTSYLLKSGKTKSCGCLHRELLTERNLKHGQSYAGKKTIEFCLWQNMKSRCYNPKNNHYKYYGERNIKVCERWLNSFENFFSDMGERPSELHSIDRINNNGHYEPSNCRWALDYVQVRNKTNNRWIEYNGERKILTDWAIELNCTVSQLCSFLRNHKGEDFVNHFKSITT